MNQKNACLFLAHIIIKKQYNNYDDGIIKLRNQNLK